MATKRAFAYNPSQTPISGVTQAGDIAVGGFDVDDTKWPLGLGGLTWWAGPDEDLGWVIAKVKEDGDQPNGLGVPAYIGFNRSLQLTDTSFIHIVNRVFGTTHTTAVSCKEYIDANGYWTNWQNLFEFTINTANTSTGSTAANRFKLPLVSSGTINFTVDWGDGTSNTITSWNQAETTHSYATSGEYTIKIDGVVKGWQFNSTGDRLKILDIIRWGEFNISVGSGFYGCANLTSSAIDSPTISSTTLAGYFYGCTNFNSSISNWNTSSVTDMSGMFREATTFNQNIGTWNTSNVTNMSNMFRNASSFNNGNSSDINTWNTSSVTDMSTMFSGASTFNQNIGSWNTSNVTNMSGMFQSASLFNQNIGNWNIIKVINLSSMFSVALVFNNGGSSDINTWNTSSVTDMSYIFFGAAGFNQNIGNWNTSNVTNMLQLFNGATIFNQNIGSWNTSNVTTMLGMFNGALLFNQNIGSWNTSNVTNMNTMFQLANAFNQNIGAWNVSKVTNLSGFMNGKSLLNFSATNLDAIYNGWSSRAVKPNITISFGSAKYTAAGSAGRSSLTSSPNLWTITDGGL